MTRTFAAADLGSNTAHLLVAATDGELVMRVDNYNEWIPLGEVVSKEGVIPKDISQQLVMAIKEFKRLSASKKAEGIYLFATEGVRMARNHQQIIAKIEGETGVKVDLISPRREAELSLRGMLLDTKHLGVDTLFEVGGGSAQVGRLEKNELIEEESLALGTGRVIAESGLRNPCPEYALRAAENYIAHVLERSTVHGASKVAVACGGVARGLWRAIHPDGEKQISIEEIDYIAWSTTRLPIDRIVNRFGVKTKRAGTLLPGAIVYRALMRKFDISEMVVSEFGVREGAVLEMADAKVPLCPV